MSTTIDQRVVEMRFDNKRFESNVSTTLSTLEKLKQSLNFKGANKGLEEVNSAAKKCDMSALSNGIETARLKFSALQIMGITALTRITNSAITAGKRIVSALTIDPVKTGFQEYETQINAVQTILANTKSKGKTLDDVNAALDELNTYADKTIYNFTEMTRNIGTFTAAGVDLDTSVSAIKGIANLAAVSGSTSQQASTAMYQLSQAMASGTVKLMDWNSVVNAGMGGQVFQDALKETAKVHGIAIDDIIKKQGSFRESLSEGWLTTEILTETLSKFTGDLTEEQLKSMGYTEEQIKGIVEMGKTANDAATKVKTFTQLFDTLKEAAQSGWTQTWEIIVGDFEEAKAFLTEISDIIGGMIGSSAEARNELLENWKVMGGRDDLLQSLRNAFEGIMSIIKPIKEAFRDIFPPITSEQLFKFTEGLKNLTAKLKISDGTADKIKRTFKGLFAIVDIVRQVFAAAFEAVGSMTGELGGLGSGILDVTASIGDWLVSLNNAIKKGNVFNKIFQGIATVIKKMISGIGNLASWINTNFIDPIFNAGEAANEMQSKVSSAFDSMGAAVESSGIYKVLQSVWKGITTIATGIAKAFSSITGGLFEKLGNGDFQGVLDFINGLITGGIGIGIAKLVHNLSDSVKGFGDFKDGIIDIIDGVGGCLEGFQNKLKAAALQKIATAIAILAASLLVLSLIDSNKLEGALAAITVLFTELMVAMSVFSKIAGNFKGVTKACFAMISVSTAVLILAASLRTIAGLELSELATGLLGVAGLMGVVVATIKLLDGNKAVKGAVQMIIFAAAIKILASVCEDLSYFSWEELGKGLVGIAAMAGIIVATAKLLAMGKNKDVIKGATQMVIFAAAIKIMASACGDLSQLSWEGIGKGLTAIAGLLAEVVIFTKLNANTKHLLTSGVALIAISAAIKIFASAARDLGSLSWEEIGKGLVSMAGALLAITVAMKLMPKDMISKAVGLVVIASALLIVAEALGKMGGMSWESIGKSMVSLGGSMLILAIGLNVMKSTLAGSAALLVASMSLGILASVLIKLGNMSWTSIGKSLLTLAGAFVVIGVAGYALAGAVPAIMALAGAIALIGVGVLAAGVGLMAFGAGLSALSVGLVALASSIGVICTGIVSLVEALIVGVLKGIANGIVAFCEVFIQGIPAIGEAIKVFVLTCCDILIECVPVLADTLLKVVVALLQSLVDYTPKIVDSLFAFLIGILDGIARNLPDLIKAGVNIVMSLFVGIIDALKSIDPNVLIKGILSIGLMVGLMAALAAVAGMVPAAMVGVLGMGAVVAELAVVLAAIGALAQIPGLSWLIEEGGDFLQTIGTAIGKFIGGIAGGIAQGFTSSLPQIGTDLSTFMINLQPFIDGASSFDASTLDGVKSLIGVIMALTGANIIESLTSWLTGGSSLTKFGEELAAFGPNMKAYADAICDIDPEAVQASASAAKALAEMTAVIPNQGGMVAWFTGENSIAKFGNEIVTLGHGLKGFSDAVAGIIPENIIAAANAAKALADMASTVPNQGGVVSWFTGDNSIAKFGNELVDLGEGLKGFSDAIVGVVPENLIAAANAAKALADMTLIIPNEGGMVAWFTGDNSISKFGEDLVSLGQGLKGFSDSIIGVNPENLTAAAGAAKALADITNVLPNKGGMVAWFTGEASISKFGAELPLLGAGLKGFSDSVMGIVPENLIAAANAAKSLAELTSVIPNEGGVVAWFTGESSIANFGSQLIFLGAGLKGFSDAITGIVPENLTAAAGAAKNLAEMASYIPNQGGVAAWFTGESSISKFSSELVKLGEGLKGFSDKIAGINPENVTAAANAAKALAEMTTVIPKEGGIKAWFTGETSIANFADKLPTLGDGLKGFSDSVAGINPENVTAAAEAAKNLGQMAETVPGDTSKIISFGENIVKFGDKLKSYFSKTADISADSLSASTKAIDAVKEASSVNSANIKTAADAITNIAKALKNLAKVPKNCTSEFKKALSDLGKSSSKALVDAFEKIDDDMKKAGKKALDAFISGLKSKKSAAEKACKSVAEACADAIGDKSSSFKSAGKDLVDGFVSGISANTFKAEAKAAAMAKAAAKAAEEALDINSPSKVFRKIGMSVPEGFALGIDKLGGAVATSSVYMSDVAINGVKDSISRIADIIGSDIDSQPTIRPVLDLSDIRSGAGLIGGLFNDGQVGVSANIGAISTMMGRRNQNGELISAIDELRKDLGKVGNTTYQVGDITYSEGTEVADAIRTILRALKIEGRT